MTGESASETVPKRDIPPLYKSSGSISSDRLAFFHILERLKVGASICIAETVGHLCLLQTQKRTGWVNNKARRVLRTCWFSLTRLPRTADTQP
jgi:putative hydrolase of HD superfamily